MTITLQLSADQERRFQESAARRDFDVARAILHQAVDSQVEKILEARQPETKSLRVLLTELAAELPDLPVLSEEALKRSSIYDDHS